MSTITFTISYSNGAFISTPASQTATAKNTTISFVFSDDTPKKFTFTGYSSNDSKQQLGTATISSDGRSMTVPNANTEAETINITCNITDTETRGSYGSHSEVENDPPH